MKNFAIKKFLFVTASFLLNLKRWLGFNEIFSVIVVFVDKAKLSIVTSVLVWVATDN